MKIPEFYSIDIIQKQYVTGEQPVLVRCSDLNEYVCKYMRSSATPYKLICEVIGAVLASFLHQIGLIGVGNLLLNIIMNVEMDKLQYSVIYAVIRPDMTEKISVGIIILDGSEIKVHYSDNKLKALKYLFPQGKYDFINRAVRKLPYNNTVTSKKDIDYLSRYCNNLIAFSPLHTIDIEPTEENKKWLFNNYVESLVEVQ